MLKIWSDSDNSRTKRKNNLEDIFHEIRHTIYLKNNESEIYWVMWTVRKRADSMIEWSDLTVDEDYNWRTPKWELLLKKDSFWSHYTI